MKNFITKITDLMVINTFSRIVFWVMWDVFFFLWDIFIIRGVCGYILAAVMVVLLFAHVILYRMLRKKDEN